MDVCGTLYDANTTAEFVRFHHEKAGGRGWFRFLSICSSRKLPARSFLILFGKIVGIDFLRNLHIFSLKKFNRSELNDSAKKYLSKLHCAKIDASHQLLQKMEEEGWKIILVSNSLDCVIGCIGNHLGFSWIASKIAYRSDLCCGKLEDDLKGNKRKAVEKYLNLDLNTISCGTLTDNKSDRDLLLVSDPTVLVVQGKKIKDWMKEYDNASFIYY